MQATDGQTERQTDRQTTGSCRSNEHWRVTSFKLVKNRPLFVDHGPFPIHCRNTQLRPTDQHPKILGILLLADARQELDGQRCCRTWIDQGATVRLYVGTYLHYSKVVELEGLNNSMCYAKARSVV